MRNFDFRLGQGNVVTPVCLFTGDEGVCIQGFCKQGGFELGVCIQGRGGGVSLPEGGMHGGGSTLSYICLSPGGLPLGGLPPWGVCLHGGSAWGGMLTPRTRKTGGTHPTGMLSCFDELLHKMTTSGDSN